MPVWVPYMIIVLLFELSGDVVAKEYAIHGTGWRMFLAAALVVCGNLTWQLMLRRGVELGRAGIIFAVGVAIGLIMIGSLVYGEKVGSRAAAGVAFGIASIWLLA